MGFKIIYEPLNRTAGVEPKSVEIDAVEKAWLEVHGLMNSDERAQFRRTGGPFLGRRSGTGLTKRPTDAQRTKADGTAV